MLGAGGGELAAHGGGGGVDAVGAEVTSATGECCEERIFALAGFALVAAGGHVADVFAMAVGAGHSFDEVNVAVVLPTRWGGGTDFQGGMAKIAAVIRHLSGNIEENFVFGVEFGFVIG